MNVGIVGLGKMGVPIARRLLAGGHIVHVYNRSAAAVDMLAQEGANAAGSATEVASSSEIVLTALPTTESVQSVYEEMAQVARNGQIYIDHSTVGLNLSRDCATVLAGRGADFLDAPVSGGPAGAERGTLTIMVGGDEAVLKRALHVLQAYGRQIHRCGPVGAGQTVKLVNQLLVAIHTAASAEAVTFGAKLGADPRVLLEVLGSSFGASAMLSRNLPRFISGDYSGATPVGLILKDLVLVMDEALRGGSPLLLGALVQQLFVEAKVRGMAGDDMSSIVRLAEEAASVQLGPH